MSKSINLVEYPSGIDGKIYETKAELIESSFISSDLYEEIVKAGPLVKRYVYESGSSEDCYTIECFNDSAVKETISKLEDIFIKTLKCESERIICRGGNSGSTQLLVQSPSIVQAMDLQSSITIFRTITNVIHVFRLKLDKYSENTSVVLKVG